jgi:GNAT superfamily N-acetyltransferase
VDYRPAYKKHFRTLNESWLREYFTVESADAHLLADPNGRIIRKGGLVLFALWDGDVVGTAALLRHGPDVWELAKMAVAAAVRGRGIGRVLAEAVLARAREEGAVRLYLQTSSRLEAALRLYRTLGFRRVRNHPLPGDPYCRCTITMKLDLVPTPARPSHQAG